MAIEFQLPADLLREVESHAIREGSDLHDAVTTLVRIGLATATSVISVPDEAMLERRRAMTEKFIAGEWGVELVGFDEARAMDRTRAKEIAKAWRE